MFKLNLLKKFINYLYPKYLSNRWKNLDKQTIQRDWKSNFNSKDIDNFLENLIGDDFETLLEIGCSCGNKLYNIATKMKDKKFTGVDINHHAINFGNAYCKINSISNLNFKELDILEKNAYKTSHKFDVVLVWATLIYVHPLFIKRALKNILELSNKKIILIEQNEPSLVSWPKYLGYQIANGPNWSRNYCKILFKIMPTLNSDNLKTANLAQKIWAPGGGNAQALVVNLTQH